MRPFSRGAELKKVQTKKEENKKIFVKNSQKSID